MKRYFIIALLLLAVFINKYQASVKRITSYRRHAWRDNSFLLSAKMLFTKLAKK